LISFIVLFANIFSQILNVWYSTVILYNFHIVTCLMSYKMVQQLLYTSVLLFCFLSKLSLKPDIANVFKLVLMNNCENSRSEKTHNLGTYLQFNP
jgi:hypothetical protein